MFYFEGFNLADFWSLFPFLNNYMWVFILPLLWLLFATMGNFFCGCCWYMMQISWLCIHIFLPSYHVEFGSPKDTLFIYVASSKCYDWIQSSFFHLVDFFLLRDYVLEDPQVPLLPNRTNDSRWDGIPDCFRLRPNFRDDPTFHDSNVRLIEDPWDSHHGGESRPHLSHFRASPFCCINLTFNIQIKLSFFWCTAAINFWNLSHCSNSQ